MKCLFALLLLLGVTSLCAQTVQTKPDSIADDQFDILRSQAQFINKQLSAWNETCASDKGDLSDKCSSAIKVLGKELQDFIDVAGKYKAVADPNYPCVTELRTRMIATTITMFRFNLKWGGVKPDKKQLEQKAKEMAALIEARAKIGDSIEECYKNFADDK